jgi:hypothetical protein
MTRNLLLFVALVALVVFLQWLAPPMADKGGTFNPLDYYYGAGAGKHAEDAIKSKAHEQGWQ